MCVGQKRCRHWKECTDRKGHQIQASKLEGYTSTAMIACGADRNGTASGKRLLMHTTISMYGAARISFELVTDLSSVLHDNIGEAISAYNDL